MSDSTGTRFVGINTPEATKAPNFSVPVSSLRVRPAGTSPSNDFIDKGFDPLNDGFRRPKVATTVSSAKPTAERGEVKNASPKLLNEFKTSTGATFDPKNDFDHYNLSLLSDKQPMMSRQEWELAGAPKVKKAPTEAALAAGRTVGGVAGGVAGGAIGTAILPGVGTQAGKLVGSKVGAFVGEEFVKDPDGVTRTAIRFSPAGSIGVAAFDAMKGKDKNGKPDKAPESLVARVKQEQKDVEEAQRDGGKAQGAAVAKHTVQTVDPKGIAKDTMTNVKGNVSNVVQGKGIDVGDPNLQTLNPVGAAGEFAGKNVGATVGASVATAALAPALGPLAPVAGLAGGSLGEAVGGRVGTQVAETTLGPDDKATQLAKQNLEIQKRAHEALARQVEEFDDGPDIM